MRYLLIVFCLQLSLSALSKPQASIVVDGVGAGARYTDYLLELGQPVIHILSSANIHDYLLKSYQPEKYIRHFYIWDASEAEWDFVVKELERFEIKGVFAGTDTASTLVAHLQQHFRMPSNDLEKAGAWRFKDLMQAQIKKSGLRSIPSSRVFAFREALDWMQSEGISYPIVVKPRSSAGSEKLAIVNNPHDLKIAIEVILGSSNMFGEINDSVIIQKEIIGPEFAVNGVLKDGKIHFTDLWFYQKQNKNGKRLYDYDLLMDFDDPVLFKLLPYTEEILEALGIREGVFHAEIILSKGQPVLVEVAPRPMGGPGHKLVEKCTGTNQLKLAVLAALKPDIYDELTHTPYHLRSRGMLVEGLAPMSGRVSSIKAKQIVNSTEIPSLFSEQWKIDVGDKVVATEDLLTSTGHFLLAADTKEELMRDYRRIREAEKAGIKVTNKICGKILAILKRKLF